MNLLEILLYAIGVYIVFKLGEHFAYLKIALSLQNLRDTTKTNLVPLPAVGNLMVERINQQYYAYVDNIFVGQGENLNDAYEIIQNIIVTNPERFSAITIQVIE